MPVSDAPYWLQFVQPFGTIFLGVGAFTIAWRQWLTAHEKLRLDLYEKRTAAIQQIQGDLFAIVAGETVTSTDVNRVQNRMLGAKRLFGNDVSKIIEAINEELSKAETGDEDAKARLLRLQYKLDASVSGYVTFKTRSPRLPLW